VLCSNSQFRLLQETPKLGAGCLIVLLLPLGGAALGHWLDGTAGSMRGFAIGFVLGCALAAVLGWLRDKLRGGEIDSSPPAIPLGAGDAASARVILPLGRSAR
jgi:hypothetical protein